MPPSLAMAAAVRPGIDELRRLRRVLETPAGAAIPVLAALFERESAVPRRELEACLNAADVAALVALDVVRFDRQSCVPLVRVARVGALFVASDLHRHRQRPDFVVGPGPASHLLARHVRPVTGGQALDLGCGSGIQGLLLAGTGMTVTALDINPRALAFTRFNAALNDLPGITAQVGDFLTGEPDTSLDGRFDVVVANPPFVLSPASRLTYRDRPLPGDEVGSRTVEGAGRALAPGGRGYVLCNWIELRAEATIHRLDRWIEPVREWLVPLDMDAVVSRVGDLDPEAYAAIWTRDLAASERPPAIATWVAALDAEDVGRVHLGVIALARSTRTSRAPRRFATLDARRQPVGWRTIEATFGGFEGSSLT